MTIETIKYLRTVSVDDGEGGTTGELQPAFTCKAEVEAMKSSKPLEANQQSVRQGYRIKQWVTNAFEPRVGDIIAYRDEKLSLQGYSYTDETRRKYLVIALEGITGANSGTVSN